MNRTNVVVAACFLGLGFYLVFSASALPGGMGRLPGPAFFPQVIGIAVLLLSVVLLVQALKEGAAAPFQLGKPTAIGSAVGLTFLYLALWGTGFFTLRTAVFLTLFLRLLGERWRPSLTVAAVLTAAVALAFQLGLRVSLE